MRILRTKLYNKTETNAPCSNTRCKKPTPWVITIEVEEASGDVPQTMSGSACPKCVFNREWIKS